MKPLQRKNNFAAIWHAINELKENQLATQAEVSTLTEEVEKVATDLATASASLQTEIDELASANPAIDLTGLKTAVEPLDAAVEALGNLKPLTPEPPTPTP